VRYVGREAELKKLRGGATFRYLREYFFPYLRHAVLVWIYYSNDN
jgi:hypothetical protein